MAACRRLTPILAASLRERMLRAVDKRSQFVGGRGIRSSKAGRGPEQIAQAARVLWRQVPQFSNALASELATDVLGERHALTGTRQA